MNLATRAALERLGPVAVGIVAGIAGFIASPDHVTPDFFSASAQIIPVLLLALALEAQLFGSAPRARHEYTVARNLERARRALEYATVLVLVGAEVQALAALRNDDGGDPWLTIVGLASGFAVVAAIAVRGLGHARVTADIPVIREAPEGIFFLEIRVSNEFGDHAVAPTRNILFGPGANVFECDADAQKGEPFSLRGTEAVHVRGQTLTCRFSYDQPDLTAGDAGLTHCLVELEADKVLVVVRLDHVEFKGGRVECAAFLRRGSQPEFLTERIG